MTADELAGQLQGAATVVLDSNAVWGAKLLGLADRVNLVNLGRPAESRLTLCVPALVHAEHVAQERRRLGAAFRPAEPIQVLTRKNVTILSFEADDAELSAAAIVGWFPSKEDWRLAKGQRVAQALGVPCPPSVPPVPATLDWYLAAQSAGRGWWMITDDRGHEFQHLSRRARVSTFRHALARLAA